MADLADHAAATAAGYLRVQSDRGAGSTQNPRYISRYEKWLPGTTGEGGHLHKAEGQSNVSQAAADTQALVVLNLNRTDRVGKKTSAGNSHTVDVH